MATRLSKLQTTALGLLNEHGYLVSAPWYPEAPNAAQSTINSLVRRGFARWELDDEYSVRYSQRGYGPDDQWAFCRRAIAVETVSDEEINEAMESIMSLLAQRAS